MTIGKNQRYFLQQLEDDGGWVGFATKFTDNLVARGLVRARWEGRHPLMVFELTDAGREALRKAK